MAPLAKYCKYFEVYIHSESTCCTIIPTVEPLRSMDRWLMDSFGVIRVYPSYMAATLWVHMLNTVTQLLFQKCKGLLSGDIYMFLDTGPAPSPTETLVTFDSCSTGNLICGLILFQMSIFKSGFFFFLI